MQHETLKNHNTNEGAFGVADFTWRVIFTFYLLGCQLPEKI